MNPPNTIASDTLVEAVARAIDPFDPARGRHPAQAALTAITEAGFVVCPREPTPEMIRAVDDEDTDKYVARGRAYSAWKAMIATHIEGESKWPTNN